MAFYLDEAGLDKVWGKVKAGAGMTMELLWENAKPDSGFSAQTIAVDLSEFSHVMIAHKTSGCAAVASVIVKVGDRAICNANSLLAYDNWYIAFRIANTSETSIAFETGRYNNNKAQSAFDTACVPFRVYGIKGVS